MVIAPIGDLIDCRAVHWPLLLPLLVDVGCAGRIVLALPAATLSIMVISPMADAELK
eukprot:SAG31_NODE_1238_length_9176_cov_9.589181_10_plen_57_part_00